MDKYEIIDSLVELVNNPDAREFYLYVSNLSNYFKSLTTDDILSDKLNSVGYLTSVEICKSDKLTIESSIVIHRNYYDFETFSKRVKQFKKSFPNLNSKLIDYVFALPYGNLLFNKEVLKDLLMQDQKLSIIIKKL